MATPQGEQPRQVDRVAPARNPKPTDDAKTPAGGTTPQRMPPGRTWLTFFFILLVNVMLARVLFPRGETPVKVPYTLFREQVTARNVQAIYSRGASITGRFAKPVTYPRDTTGGGKPAPVTDFATELPSFADPGLETLLISNGVEISAEADPGGQHVAEPPLQLRADAAHHRALRVDLPARHEAGRGTRRGARRRHRTEHGASLRSGDRGQGHL